MLSIIIASYQNEQLKAVKKNIANSIGSDFIYELIAVWNPGIMGICEAYNKGAQKAQYPYLLFLHDDVALHTQNWGAILINHLQHLDKVGFVGIAGTIAKTKMISSWYQNLNHQEELNRYNYIQHFKYQNRKIEHRICNPLQEKASPVVALDGVFLAIEQRKFESVKFDENLLTSYHAYDLDVCLGIGKENVNYVVYDILLEHFSEGKVDQTWEDENLKVHDKWLQYLPKIITSEIPYDSMHAEHLAFYTTLDRISNYKITKLDKLKLILKVLKVYNFQKKLLNWRFINELRSRL